MPEIYTVKLNQLRQISDISGEVFQGSVAGTAHSMAKSNKAEWRSRWIDDYVVGQGVKKCNFITLPGPEMLDVKELSSKTSVLSTTLIEKRGPGVKAIVNNVTDVESKLLASARLKSLPLRRLFTQEPPALPKCTVLADKFEKLFSGSFDRPLSSLLEKSLLPADSVFCLDFCGMYLQKQHESIVNMINLVKSLDVLKGHEKIFVLNFISPMTFRTGGKMPVQLLSEYLEDKYELSKFRAYSAYDSVKEATAKFGNFLEDTVPWIAEDAKLNDALVYDPLHYQTGGTCAVGYTTNIFKFKGDH